MRSKPKVSVREVLGARFWINYVLILLVTCWIPLTASTSVLRDEAGNVLSENKQSIPVYKSYGRLASLLMDNATEESEESAARREAKQQAMGAHARAVLIHIFLSFGVSFWVWYAVLRTRKQMDQEEGTSGGA